MQFLSNKYQLAAATHEGGSSSEELPTYVVTYSTIAAKIGNVLDTGNFVEVWSIGDWRLSCLSSCG